MINFYIISIFPKMFESYFNEGIIKRAKDQKKISINLIDLRNFTSDKYRSVDDTPYGGGAGMIMKVEPIYKAVLNLKLKIKKEYPRDKIRTILFSASGSLYKQENARKLKNNFKHIILICGRYEGIDYRVSKYIASDNFSIGQYVLTGGEIPAMVVIDSITRLIPGVLGNKASLFEESFSSENFLEYPQYTKPALFQNKSKIISKKKNWEVPKVLLSGDHKKINDWKKRVQWIISG